MRKKAIIEKFFCKWRQEDLPERKIKLAKKSTKFLSKLETWLAKYDHIDRFFFFFLVTSQHHKKMVGKYFKQLWSQSFDF
jgi:hypothetical protein